MTAESATRNSVVQWLDTPTDPTALGGKARPLAALLAAGLPVPPGFVITAGAFPAALPAPLAAPPAFAATANGAAGDEAYAAVLPAAVREQIAGAYAALARRLGEAEPAVAVRSSAAAEDMRGASFAGQYETYLGVRGTGRVVAYAARCWESLWSDHAVAYRRHVEQRLGQALPPPAMSVLVQSLVAADAAGVAFTADPVSGDRAAVTINAAWGLGQSVVDGEVEADSWRVDRRTRAILEQTVGDKPTRSGPTPDAPREAVPDHLRRQPSLTTEQAASVAALALRAEEVIGGPADVEWAIAGGTLWLLQARPITTGPSISSNGSATGGGLPGVTGANGTAAGTPAGAVTQATAPAAVQPDTSEAGGVGPSAQFPFAWPDAAAAGRHWSRGGEGKDNVDPLRPLEQAVRASHHRTFLNAALIAGRPRTRLGTNINGYEYFSEGETPGTEAERALHREGFQRAGDAIHARGESYRYAVHFPEIDAGNERLAAVDVLALDPPALATYFEDAFAWFERAWTVHWSVPQNGPQDRFRALYKELTGDEREHAVGELLEYEPNLLIDAIDGLMELAGIVQQHPALRELFLAAEPAAALAALDRTEGGATFRARLDALLETQGLRCGAGFGTEQVNCLPGWREDPSLVVALVQKYVPQDLDALRAARRGAVERRDRRTEEVRQSIADEERRRQFDFWLAAARRAQQGFEDHNYKIDSAAGALLHYAVTGCARALAAAGVLPTAGDVWWLEPQEIALALRSLPATEAATEAASGASPAPAPVARSGETPHWHRLIAARKAMHEWYRSLTPPPTLGAPPPPAEQKPAPPATNGAAKAEARPDPEHLLVKGQTGSTGTTTGRVRLVDHRAMVPDVEAGDVLVAHNAGPLWTPVFPIVAAVVLDEGVLFQHAMLTCREYAVPAIFQTKDATKRLREGQRVVVDATNGWVLPAD